MAIKFRIADTTREDMESLRTSMRRKAACLMSAILLGILVVLWVMRVIIPPVPVPSFTIYSPEENTSEVEETNRPKDLSTDSSQQMQQPLPDIIVSTEVSSSPTSLPFDMPDFVAGPGSGDLVGAGDGLGEGLGSGSKGGSMGGKKLDSAFLGVFYDFKKKNDGTESPLAGRQTTHNGDVLDLESKFVNKAWDFQNFAPYYRSRQQLYTTCFYMPNCLDREASNAYDPDGKMGLKPGRWAAVYRAKVQAPSSGKFRFVGVADSVMAVRFDGKNVLYCGLHNLKTSGWNEWMLEASPSATQGREMFAYSSCPFWNEQSGGFVAGDVFTVKKDQWYEMQVLVSEIGGGEFGFCLLIDNVDDTKKRTKDGVPIFQLFRTAWSEPTAAEAYENIKYKSEGGETDPPYDPDSEIWKAKPVTPDVRMK